MARPVIAEAIVNAVAHRNYRHNGFVQIIVYADRIEVWNPGELPPGLTPDLLRNPHIVAAFRRLGLCEQAGTGIRMVLNQWKALGHPEPVYENDRSRKAFEMRLPLGQNQVTGEVQAQVGTKSGPSPDSA